MRKWRLEFSRFKMQGREFDNWNGAYAIPHHRKRLEIIQ